MGEPLLEVKDLKVSFQVNKNLLTAVDGVNFTLEEGRVLGIVGESGCGKSVTATSIMRLVPPSVSIIDSKSQILFRGEDLAKATEARMRQVRGSEISMIFQEPMSSLNQPGRCPGPLCANAGPGRHSIPGAACQGVSPPAFRRNAAARHDRHGAAVRPQAPDRR